MARNEFKYWIQGSGARYGQAGITGGQNFGVGHMDQYDVNQRYTQPPPQ